jgi:hypothetical protein
VISNLEEAMVRGRHRRILTSEGTEERWAHTGVRQQNKGGPISGGGLVVVPYRSSVSIVNLLRHLNVDPRQNAYAKILLKGYGLDESTLVG